MSSPWKKQPEDVIGCVLKRAEVSKVARQLQGRLALAQFKTKHGWEELTFDTIEPKLEQEIRRKRTVDGDGLSDSSSNTSDLPYPVRGAMSSPLKAPLFSDAVGSSSGSSGHRKRTFYASFDIPASSSPSKRLRGSPITHKSFSGAGNAWKHTHQLAQSSPIKPRRQQHFTTSAGPDVSFFQTRRLTNELASPNFAAASDDEDDIPIHSFMTNNVRSSPPRTPPMQTRSLASKRSKDDFGTGKGKGKSGEEGADLLLYLAASPSPAVQTRGGMEPPSTPPQKSSKLDLPSSMMTTPGGSNMFPNTPGPAFDLSEFVNITPSPAQKPWKTPGGLASTRTPLSVARRRLTFDEPLA